MKIGDIDVWYWHTRGCSNFSNPFDNFYYNLVSYFLQKTISKQIVVRSLIKFFDCSIRSTLPKSRCLLGGCIIYLQFCIKLTYSKLFNTVSNCCFFIQELTKTTILISKIICITCQ